MPKDLLTPPALVASAEDVSALAGEFKAIDHEVEVGLRQNVDKMMRLGRIVQKWQAACRPGTFQAEFEKRCPGKLRSAYRYLRVLKRKAEVQNADNLGDALQPYADDIEVPAEAETQSHSSESGRQRDTATRPTTQSSERQGSNPKPGKDKPAQTTAAPTPPESPTERVKRKVSAVLDKLAELNMDMEDVIHTPVGLAALEVAEELKVKIEQEFHGQEDRFGRASDTKGERHYYPVPVKELIQWWTTFLGRLENPAEVDF